MITIGKVMSEAMAVIYLADALTFYRMTIEMINLHIFKGGFVQTAVECTHLVIISFKQCKNLDLAARMSGTAVSILERDTETWTLN